MLVKRIHTLAAAYKDRLQSRRPLPDDFIWQSVHHFQAHWDGAAPDLAKMYENSLQNSVSRRLWKGTNFAPKEMMLRFMLMEPDFCRRMFADLFDEEQNIENRISRFKFGCDTLLADYKQQQRASIENRHFHEDNRMLSLYLCFRYPLQYAPFDHPAFERCMQQLGNTDIPGPYEIGRYFKLLRILQKFLLKNEKLKSLYLRRAGQDKQFGEAPLMMALDFCRFCQQKRST